MNDLISICLSFKIKIIYLSIFVFIKLKFLIIPSPNIKDHRLRARTWGSILLRPYDDLSHQHAIFTRKALKGHVCGCAITCVGAQLGL